MKRILNLSLLAFVAITLTSCFKFDEPSKKEPVTFVPEKVMSIAKFKALYDGTLVIRDSITIEGADTIIVQDTTFIPRPSGPLIILDSIIISGRVVSDDQAGNIAREVIIQDSTGGIKVKVGRYSLYNFYRLGQTLHINCLGLTLGNYGGTLELGRRSTDTRYETGFIEVPWLIDRHILQGEHGTPIQPEILTIDSLDQTMVNTLVKIENLTFTPDTVPGALMTWAIGGSAPAFGNHIFVDSRGNSITVRTSGYARFAGDLVPRRSVNLTGILSIFNRNYQLTIRDLNDVE